MQRSTRAALLVLACAVGFADVSAGAALSQPPGAPRRRLRRRQRPRHRRARGGRAARHRSRAEFLCREPSRRQRHHRRQGGRRCGAGRLHAALYQLRRFSTTPYIYKKAGVRRPARFRADRDRGILDGYRAGGQRRDADQDGPRIDRLCQDEPRALRLARRRQSPAHRRPSCSTCKTGIKLEHVPYRGASEVVTALLQGSIQVTFLTPTSAVALVEEGKLRAIGFSGSKPFPELPNVPLVSASVPTFPPSSTWGIFFAPAKTPAAIVDKLNGAIQHALNSAGGRQCGAAKRLHPRWTHRRADGGILPQGSRGGRRGGEGRRHPAELNSQNRMRTMPYANIRGVAINYEILGDRGPSMMLSPGGRNRLLATSCRSPSSMAAKGYRVLLHDRRNCGASDVVVRSGASRNTRSGPTISTRCCGSSTWRRRSSAAARRARGSRSPSRCGIRSRCAR